MWKSCAVLSVASAAFVALACGGSSPDAARTIEPARPAGAIPSADRSALRGRVAYSTSAGDIWVMNADGSHRIRVTRSGSGLDFDPSWSPRARALVFRTSRGDYRPDPRGSGAEGLFVVDVRSGRERQIQPRTGGLFPAWSPDGRLIAFSGLTRLPGDTIHLITPRGERIRRLGGAFAGAQEHTTWSPDGSRLAFSQHDGDGNWALWVMNRDGSARRQLTHPEPVEPRGTGGDHPGAWSPDGRRIVYSGGQGAGRELFVIGSDGGGAYRLTDWPGADGAAAWLPSGEIVFAHFDGDEPMPEWYLVDPDGTNLRSLPWFSGAGDPIVWIIP
jgi:Tol biopolymer transport system component